VRACKEASGKTFRWLRPFLPGFALAAIAAAPAMANTITFAQAIDFSLGQDWSISTSGAGCASGAGPCTTSISITSSGFNSLFSFLPASTLSIVGQQSNFTLTATSTTIGNCATTCGNGDGYTEAGFNGSFEYVGLTGPYVGKVFLKATFTNATFGSTINGGTGSVGYNGSISLGNLTMTSDFLSFMNQTNENASWTFSSVTPAFTVGTVTAADQAFPSVGTITATGTGTFATAPGFAPEPGSLTLFTAGAGLLALMGRRRFQKKNQ
jgi:hypothetical protein